MSPVHTVADVTRWILSRFRHPVDHAKWLHAACLLSYCGYDRGFWFSFFDMRSHEFGYGTGSQAELDSITELAKSPLHREEFRAMLASNANPLGGQQKDRLLCIFEGRHSEARPHSEFPNRGTRRTQRKRSPLAASPRTGGTWFRTRNPEACKTAPPVKRWRRTSKS